MNVDLRRVARAWVLTAWAGFFVYLWASGEMTRYLGPRTLWVVPFGVVVLSIAAVAHVATLRGTSRAGISLPEATGLIVLLLPIVAVVLVPDATLGAHAASRKNAAAGGVGFVAPLEPRQAEVSFLDIQFAGESEEYARAAGIIDGIDVSLIGFVTHAEPRPEGAFGLSRFYVSCCAADAIPYSVFVAPDDGVRYPDDTWLEVRGRLERRETSSS